MDTTGVSQRVQEYVAFLESTLRPDHDKARALAEQVRTEINDYQLLQQQIKHRNLPTAPVDLGFGVLNCEVAARQCDSILVHVGMGFHVDLTFDEADIAIEQRLKYLNDRLKTRQSRADTIRDHITSTEEILSKLSRLSTLA